MNRGEPVYPPIEIEFLKLLKELQPIIVKALNSLAGKKPANAGSKYLGIIAKTINRASDGYLFLRESGRMDASKLMIRPALEAVQLTRKNSIPHRRLGSDQAVSGLLTPYADRVGRYPPGFRDDFAHAC